MTAQLIRNNSEARAEQAASNKLKTIKRGLDVHADSIVVVRILDHSAPQPAQKFTPARFIAWVKTQLPLAGSGGPPLLFAHPGVGLTTQALGGTQLRQAASGAQSL